MIDPTTAPQPAVADWLPPTATPARRSGKKIALIAGGGIAALFLLCLAGGTAIGKATPGANPTVTVTETAPAPTVTVTETASAAPAATVTSTVTATATAAPAPAAAAGSTIDDGTWTVGADVAAGTYKVTAPVSSGFCYWGIYRSGTNQQAIVNNGIESGGRPQVTLKAGQDFKTDGCGTWAKVR